MANQKVIDFLYQNGFDEDDIRDFFYVENDGFDGKGNPDYGPDFLYAKVKTDEVRVELRETGETVEEYWEKGWVSGNYEFHPANFDSYRGRYYKAFPTRYKLWEFKFSKSLRRVLNKNHDLQWIVRPLRITPEKSFLYDNYNLLRHGEMPKKPLVEMYKYAHDGNSKKMELCIFKNKRLVACSFFETGTFSTYGNAAFWDTNETSRSLGTLTLLLEIKYALNLGSSYHYLGHFYAQNPAYHYKTRFPGLQLFDWDGNVWVDFKYQSRIKQMLLQKLPRHKD